MSRIDKMAEKVAGERMAAWTDTKEHKNLSSRSSLVRHYSRETDRMASELLRDLSSPIVELTEIASVLTKVRGLKATLTGLTSAVNMTYETVESLEDELMSRMGE